MIKEKNWFEESIVAVCIFFHSKYIHPQTDGSRVYQMMLELGVAAVEQNLQKLCILHVLHVFCQM